MAKEVQVRAPQPRVVYYVDPAQQQTVVFRSPAEVAAKRAEQQLLYMQWKLRQAEYAARNRKVRRFWLGFGATVGVSLLAGIGVGGWLLYRVATGATIGLAVILLIALGVPMLGAVGHKCITIVQHWH